MAQKLDGTGETNDDESSKEYLNRREYLEATAAAAAIIAGSGTGLSGAASADGTASSFSTGFGEYVS